MVDHFAIAVTHALIAIMLWRLLSRTDLDNELWMVPPQFSPQDANAPSQTIDTPDA